MSYRATREASCRDGDFRALQLRLPLRLRWQVTRLRAIRRMRRASPPAGRRQAQVRNTAPTRVRDSSAKVAALEHEKARVEHRAAIAAVRKRMPRRPIPGEPGFTGVPPAGERRFVPDEMVLHVSPTVSAQKLDDAARKLGLTRLASQTVGLTGGTLIHFRAVPGRPVAELVRALEAEKIGIAQPNYVFKLQQDATLSARSKGGDPGAICREQTAPRRGAPACYREQCVGCGH